MTIEQAHERLSNIKCYVNGKVEEILPILNRIGFERDPDLNYLNAPFIETTNDTVYPSYGMMQFKQSELIEVTVDSILTLNID